MNGIESRHPPGLVVMMTGELARYADTFADMAALSVPLHSGMTWFRGVLIADGLNKSLEVLYRHPNFEWAWIMGDDHRFSIDALMKLLDRDVDVVIPACLHRHPPFNSTIMRIDKDGTKSGTPIYNLPTSGLYKLGDGESCGDAGMLIRKRVLDAIPQPWYNTRRSGAFASDDTAFTNRIREAGFDIHVDTEVPLGHITPMSVTPRIENGEWTLRVDVGEKPVASIGGRWGG